ncbi:MAG: nucleotidyltransferase domain-containing protein [Nanoarchaeota archaeon]|nr:nucleotidyltransferase domain-containing protein [Nanoarchaeota archaeon]
MLKELLRNTRLMSRVHSIIKENEDQLLDIVLFGSLVRGKEKPRDIDLLLIYKTKINSELSYEIKKQFEVFGVEVDLVSKTYSDLFKSAFVARESFLSEGFSLAQKKFVAEALGFKPMVLFRYDIKNLNKSQRMRFYYSLYGRNTEGMLKELKLYKFSERVIIAPLEEVERVKEYLNSWNIKCLEVPILIPSRIVDSEAFKEK